MTKLDLKTTSGFPLSLEDNKLIATGVEISNSKDFTIDDLRPELLNKELNTPEIFYTKHYGIDNDHIYKDKKLTINLYVIPSNLAGIEYTKTKGSVITKYPRILEIVNGTAMIILQNFEQTFEGDIIINTVRKGQKIIIPPNYYLSISNPRQSTLVISEVYSINAQENLDLDEMEGMSYYVIRKNAKQEIVRNPMYRIVNKFRKISWDSIILKQGLTLKTPIIKQLLRKYEKVSWLFKENSFTI